MRIKEYEATTLRECLQQVRGDLGPDAVILETKKARRGGYLGLGSRDVVVVVAGIGISVDKSRPPQVERAPAEAARASSGRSGSEDATFRPWVTDGAPGRAVVREPASAADEDEQIRRLEAELAELRAGVEAMRMAVSAGSAPAAATGPATATATVTAPAPFGGLKQRMLDNDIPPEVADEFLRALPDLSGWQVQARESLAESALRDLMVQRVRCCGGIVLTPGKTKIVALIGPTGVGKTTTIAKLAAHFALVAKKRVALLTVDTYRIAAVEQLKTYAQIIDVPVRVIYNPPEIGPAMQEFAGYDLVLIDTAGRSQKNAMQCRELKAIVDAVPCETHLLIAASTRQRDMLDHVERFQRVRVDRLIFSKLDESVTYGTVFATAALTGVPVSYVTTGQRVPEDIEVADAAKLCGLALNAVRTPQAA